MVLERGWLSANNILFIGAAQTALVDSGYHTHSEQTIALLRRALAGRPLDWLINTHLHSDHCGGNAALQAAYPALRTLIPPGQAAQVRDWDAGALSYEPTGQHCPPFKIDGVLEPGSQLRLGDSDWQVHAAPGHDPHSVVLFEPASRTLISADALWHNGFGVVFPEIEGESGFAEVAATLDLIDSLAPQHVIPGHGAPFDDVGAALARARSRLAVWRQNPIKHAAHAAKVLLKYKLLELQRAPLSDFMRWALATPYFALLHDRYFASEPIAVWVGTLVDDLVRAGAAVRQGDMLLDHG
ncbi:MAG: MBL fold metallo-hydrolase [Burkholderiales bacterium]